MNREETCEWPSCSLPMVTSAAAIQHRRRQQLLYVCRSHMYEFRKEYFSSPFHSAHQCNASDDAPFDLFLVFHAENRSMLWLREIGGATGIGIATGPAQGYSLQARLGVERPPLPSPHGALVEVARALGGRVERIVVSDYEEGERYIVLYCHVSLEQNGRLIDVNLKASDAFALALETSAPIVVQREVLRRMPRFVEDRGGLYLPDTEH